MGTKQANPWSVKGIETNTRETAKEAARKAGMTVGQWLNTVIQQSASELGAARDRHMTSRPMAAGPGTANLDEHFDTLEARLSEMAQHLRSIQSLSALQTPADDRFSSDDDSRSPVVRRLENDVMDLAEAIHTLTRRFDRSESDARSAWTSIENRLGSLDDKLDRISASSSTAPLVEDVNAMVAQPLPQSAPDRDRQEAILEQISSLRSRIDARDRAPAPQVDVPPALTSTLSKLADQLDALQHRVEATPDPSADIDRENRLIAAIGDKLAQMESSLHAVTRSFDPDALTSRIVSEQTHAMADITRRQQAELSQATNEFMDLQQAVNDIAARQVALEDTVTGGYHPSEFDHRFDQMARQLDSALMDRQPDFDAVGRQLDSLAALVQEAGAAPRADLDRLAQRFSRLEAHVAQALERQDRLHPDLTQSLNTLADRLAKPDPRVDAIKTRLDALAAKIDHGIEARIPNIDALQTQMRQIGDRIASSAGATSGLELSQLDTRLRALSDQVDRALKGTAGIASIEAKLNAIDKRIETGLARPMPADTANIEAQLNLIGRQIERGLAAKSAPSADTEHLEARLDAIGDRIVKSLVVQPSPPSEIHALGDKLNAISERLDKTLENRDRAPDLAAFETKLARMGADIQNAIAQHRPDTRAMEDRIAKLVDRLNAQSHGAANVNPAKLNGLTKQIEVLNANLNAMRRRDRADPRDLSAMESQIAAISSRIDDTQSQAQAIQAIEKNLTALFSRLDSTQSTAIDAARDAARQAIVEAGTDSVRTPGGVFDDLQDRIREIHDQSIHADRRTRETLAAVHETLNDIVARMRTLEDGRLAQPPAAAAPAQPIMPAEPDAPERTMDPSVDALTSQAAPAPTPTAPDLPRPLDPPDAPPSATEPQASPAAQSDLVKTALMVHAQKQEEVQGQQKRRFGLPSLKLGRKSEEPPIAQQASAPTLDDQPALPEEPQKDESAIEPAVEPTLEPSPPKRARVLAGDATAPNRQRGQQSGQTDFIAAARRAAQAAAEADLEEQDARAASESVSFGDRLSKLRKPVTYAALAILLVFGGVQAFSLLSGPEQSDAPDAVVSSSLEPTAVDQVPGEPTVEEAATAPNPVRIIETTPSEGTIAPTAGAPEADISLPGSGVTADAALPDPVETQAIDATATNLPPADLPDGLFPDRLREAALAGDPVAQFEVAARFADDSALQSDLFRAAEWYARAAGQGLAPAQYRLGSLYEKGQGPQKDLELAKLWYERGAVQGNRKAMHNLAVLLVNDETGADYTAAAKWFESAAQLGLADSQFNLGILRARGLGVEQNLAESFKWFALAAAQGDGDAAEKRDQLTKSLDEETLVAARLAVQSWKPQPMIENANTVQMPADGWGAEPTGTAKDDSRINLIKEAQILLNANGFDVGAPDGIVGPRTIEAIRAFERQVGLPETGEISPLLLQELTATTG